MSEDCNGKTGSNAELTIETVVSSSNQPSSCNDSDKSIPSSSVLPSKDPDDAKFIDSQSKSSSLPTVSIKKSQGESNDELPLPETACGFDSADSTNDEDFLNTQKAVLSAIDFIDEGLKDEVNISIDNTEGINTKSNNVSSENDSKTTTEKLPPEKLESFLIVDQTNCEISSGVFKNDLNNPQSKSINTVNVEDISPVGIEATSDGIKGNDEETKETTHEENNIENSSSKKLACMKSNNDANNDVLAKQGLESKDNINEIEHLIDTSNDNPNSEVKLNIDSGSLSDKFEDTDIYPKESLCIANKSDQKVSNEALNEEGEMSEKQSEKLNDSDDVIVVEEILPTSSHQAIEKETEPTLPVSVEISDVEVSVFKYERNKKEKTKKTEEFKLDDMVLSSDEDSDDSENIKPPSAIKTSEDILPDPSDMSVINLPVEMPEDVDLKCLDKTKGLDGEEQIHHTSDTNRSTMAMDVEENTCSIQGDLIKDEEETSKMDLDESGDIKDKEETSKMDLDESGDSSEQNTLEAANKSVFVENETINNSGFDIKNIEAAEIPMVDNETKSDIPITIPRNNDDFETNVKNEDSKDTKTDDNSTDLEEILRTTLSNNETFREKLSADINELENKMPSVSNDLKDLLESNDSKDVSKSNDSKDVDVICLVDDDEEDVRKKPAAAIHCVNPNCMSGEDLASPAMFVLNYFGLKRSKGQQVCAECFSTVRKHIEEMSSLLNERKPLLSAVFPSHKDVILLDSDEESFSDNEKDLPEDVMSVIRENLDDVISEQLAKVDFDFQLQESCSIIDRRLTKLEGIHSEINKRYDEVQRSLDTFRKQIYTEFQQETREKEAVHFMECEIPPMPIIKSKLQNQLYNRELMNRMKKSQQEREQREAEEQLKAMAPTRTIATKKVSQTSQSPVASESTTQEVTFVRSAAKCEPPPNLPPPGVLVRPKLRVGDLAYTMKVSYFSIWVHCRVLEIIPRNPTENDPSTETYRVKLENVKKNAVRTVTGKYLAYPTPARVQLKVGVRVIAIFKEEDDSATTKDNYYVGVIAEPPKSTNRYRYLVFFDDGYTQYCPHENVLVTLATSKNVWEDIHPEPRDFIKNYLQQYPERPMVKLSQGQIVKVEWNGRWWIVRVLEVDGSLVKVHFDADKRTEWIYRGSTRLGPMYQELAAANQRQTGSLLRSRGFGGGSHHKSDMPYVEYTRGDGENENENKPDPKAEEPVEEQAPAPRSVARKSTAKKPAEPVITNTAYTRPLVTQPPEGQLRQRKLKPRCRPIKFRPHQCSGACVAWTGHSPAAAKKYDPLVQPLMFGFHRFLSNFKGKSVVHYVAPCGRMIRSQQEMLCYLRGTKSQLTIDLFDFDFWVNPLNEFEEGNTFGNIEDLSYGKENVRISCVNELDHSMPQYVQYMTARQPAKDVNLNLDPEFLVGCDCTDDCEDRSKCSCWQLTLQGKAYVPDGDLDPLFGYQYRRLPERIATGIYECNSRCKCSMTCQNRVAQQPLSCRLQLFKTLKKGWGIRCLHDIPRGAFICIYAGFLLTEQEANEGGKTYGDEYLAELDYIESVESLKEGYESEAKEPSDLEDDDDVSQKDTMDIEYEHSQDSDGEEEQGYTTGRPGDIRLRLRRRTADEAEKESRKSRTDDDTISISDDELDSVRKPKTFDANITVNEGDDEESKYPSVRELYGPEENVYIMDAKTHGNIGRYLNHSCSPNVFVQNVFVDTHDLRFPWVAFFANQYIQAGTELTWDYNYDVGSVPGKVMLCYCGSNHCRGRLL